MNISHTWAITQLNSFVDYQGNPNAVYGILFSLTSVDADSGFKVEQHSSVSFQPHTIVDFQPYATLTESTVIGWVHNLLNTAQDSIKAEDGVTILLNPDGTPQMGLPYTVDGVGKMESLAVLQITEMITPKIVSLPLPWSM